MTMNSETSRPRGGRTTRDQQTHEAEAQGAEVAFDDSFLFSDGGPLPQIPARPGYAQYWARARHGNTDDARNMLVKKQRGWLPRAADSVPKVYQAMADTDGVISTHDLVLMERPDVLQKRVVSHIKKETDDRAAAVKRNIFRDHKNLGGSDTGVSAPEVEDRNRVERGQPSLLDDD